MLQINIYSPVYGVSALVLKGPVDTFTYPELESAVNLCWAEKQYQLIVDLSEVSYLSSPGLGVLLQAVRVARENHGQVTLVCPKTGIKTTLELMGFGRVAKITDNMEAALKTFLEAKPGTPKGCPDALREGKHNLG